MLVRTITLSWRRIVEACKRISSGMKPPSKTYKLLYRTWSKKKMIAHQNEFLYEGYGLSISKTFTRRWYIFGRKTRSE